MDSAVGFNRPHVTYNGVKMYSDAEKGLLTMGRDTADGVVRPYWRFPYHSYIPFMVVKEYNDSARCTTERITLRHARFSILQQSSALL